MMVPRVWLYMTVRLWLAMRLRLLVEDDDDDDDYMARESLKAAAHSL